MPLAPTKWIKRVAEFLPKKDAHRLPGGARGIYVLFRRRRLVRHGKRCFDVVYVGLSKTGIRSRLRAHLRSRSKSALWSHFSVFEVWDNVSNEEIGELEGLFRHIYRRDSKANRLNVQRKYRPIQRVRLDDLSAWR